MVMGENAYWVEANIGGIECLQCHAIINAEDFNSYELIDIDIRRNDKVCEVWSDNRGYVGGLVWSIIARHP